MERPAKPAAAADSVCEMAKMAAMLTAMTPMKSSEMQSHLFITASKYSGLLLMLTRLKNWRVNRSWCRKALILVTPWRHSWK
jgi:hypothetical protein